MGTRIRTVFAAGLAAVFVATPYAASSSTLVIGKPFATNCAIMAIEGKYDNQALSMCTRAINEDLLNTSDYAKTLVNRGVVQMRRKSMDEADRDFARAEKLMPQLPEIYINKAVILIKESRFTEAVSLIDKGIALEPDQLEKAYFNRALAREASGDVRGAYLDFTKASTLKPDWDAPKKELSRFNVQKAS